MQKWIICSSLYFSSRSLNNSKNVCEIHPGPKKEWKRHQQELQPSLFSYLGCVSRQSWGTSRESNISALSAHIRASLRAASCVVKLGQNWSCHLSYIPRLCCVGLCFAVEKCTLHRLTLLHTLFEFMLICGGLSNSKGNSYESHV